MAPRGNPAHPFVRGTSTVDLVAGDDEIVDVLLADHPAPTVIEPLRGRDMVRIEGGTQALKRTVNARLQITPDTVTTVSVPGPFGALILKSAAYTTDSRDRERHLYDAVAPFACINDPFTERETFTGADSSRCIQVNKRLPQRRPPRRAAPTGTGHCAAQEGIEP